MPGKRISKNIIQLVYFNYYESKSVKEITDIYPLKIKNIYNIATERANIIYNIKNNKQKQ